MVITADTGLIAKLYLVEPNSPQALATIQTVAPPLLVTGWHLLEMSNCFQRAVFDKRITSAQAQLCEQWDERCPAFESGGSVGFSEWDNGTGQ